MRLERSERTNHSLTECSLCAADSKYVDFCSASLPSSFLQVGVSGFAFADNGRRKERMMSKDRIMSTVEGKEGEASVVMRILSYPTETVLSNDIARNRIVLSFKDSPQKPLGRRPLPLLGIGPPPRSATARSLTRRHRHHHRRRLGCILEVTQFLRNRD